MNREWATRLGLIGGLVVLVMALFGVAEGLRAAYGAEATDSLSIAVSGSLTVALVILYYRQKEILDSQRDLLTQELNLELRQQHTETLRERVQMWLGDVSATTDNDIDTLSGMNTPAVGRSSFTSAPHGTRAASDDEGFHVLPAGLREERYVADLLTNHAPDLREKKAEIERLQSEFATCRDEFADLVADVPSAENEAFELTPTERFYEWLFEQLVSLERAYRDGWADMREVAIQDIERGGANDQSDEQTILVYAGNRRKRVIFEGDYGEQHSGDEEIAEAVHQAAITAVENLIDGIDEGSDTYAIIRTASKKLDDGETAVTELEHLLIEYEGRPIYPGECKYLTEAKIGSAAE